MCDQYHGESPERDHFPCSRVNTFEVEWIGMLGRRQSRMCHVCALWMSYHERGATRCWVIRWRALYQDTDWTYNGVYDKI
jgi:hypothetical protein